MGELKETNIKRLLYAIFLVLPKDIRYFFGNYVSYIF